MSGNWHPLDLVNDRDLEAYESLILTQFGVLTWQTKATRCLEDWLFPILKAQGFDPHRLRTRADPDLVYGYTGSAFTDLTSASASKTEADLALATVFTTVGTDCLYVGGLSPYRGLAVRMEDDVSAVASVLSVQYWAGVWRTANASDGTSQVPGKTFSGGGSILWTMPAEWAVRTLNSSDPLYWVKLTVSATPTAAKATQIGLIRASALRPAATMLTLELIYRSAPTGQDGPWIDKANFYHEEAELALERALPLIGGEFDTDESEQIDADEAEQTAAEVSQGGWRLERG